MSTRDGADPKDDPRPAVTPAEIVAVALSIIDEDGFQALSMRGIATRIGVFPAALYWHVGNRAQLLALVCETVLARIELPPDDLGWRDWLFTFGLRTRQVIGQHPRFAAYFVTNIQTSKRSLTIADRTLAALERGGFMGNDLVRAYNAVLGTIFGWTSGEFAAGDAAADAREAIESAVLGDHGETYTHIRRAWPLAANRTFMLRWESGTTSPMESSYELALTALLEGLERHRTTTPRV
jgi:AcrR family transcriptional regulator